MLKYILKRILLLIPVLIGATFIVFSVMDKVRNDALDWILTYYKTTAMSAIRVAEELSKGAKNADAIKKRK